MSSSKFHFLAPQSKATSEVDFVKPFTSYIDSVYNTSEDNKAEIQEAILELNKLRSKTCCTPQDKHQSSLDQLTRYYDQLVAIENKIVISPTQNPIVFKWRDAFEKGGLFNKMKSSLSLPDGAYERACVLFNIGALMAQIASSQSLQTDEEQKTAAKLFQQSAGVFTKLKDSVLGMVQQDPTPDLTPDCLQSLAALMVAQAQECIYIKASKDKMKSAALAKISSQASDLYAEAHKLMTRDAVRTIFEKEWFPILSGKTIAFQALAQLHQAGVNGENREIGEQISRLQEAVKISEAPGKAVIADHLIDDLAAAPKALALAKKDNDFIYHERVPEIRTLGPVPKAALAKALPVVVPLSPRFKDMFNSLVPVQVHNAMQSYEGRKMDIVNMETGRMREHTQLMNGILASLNLPAALDDVISSETLPESIKQKSAKVKQLGGITELQRLFNELPGLYKRNQEILDETSRVMTEEKESDDNLRRQFGTKWSRMSSDQLTGPLIQEVGKYRGILHTASNADKMVKDKFDANRQAIEMLSRNEVELRNSIPGQAPHAAGGATETVQKLRSLMDAVQAIKVDRERIEKDLKSVHCDIANDFLKAMAESQLLNEEQISKEKIEQLYGPKRKEVEASIKRQDDVMADVQTWNNRFANEKSGSTTGAERERVLKMLAAGHDTFSELKGNLDEGTKFYNDLTPILVRLQQKVSDFAFARQTEKEDLMRQMQQNIVSGGAPPPAAAPPPTASAPPPRPPPPRAAQGDASTPVAPPRQQPAPAPPVPQAPAQNMMAPGQQMPYQPMMQNPGQQQQQQYYQQPQMNYGQQPYPPQQPYYQPQPYQPNFAQPYPTFPGAFPNYQQPYGQYPPQPNQFPPQYQQQQQQPPHQ